jgi:hypothetical protein
MPQTNRDSRTGERVPARPHDSGSQSNETVVLRFHLTERPRLAHSGSHRLHSLFVMDGVLAWATRPIAV